MKGQCTSRVLFLMQICNTTPENPLDCMELRTSNADENEQISGLGGQEIRLGRNGGPDRDQTDDLFVANEALYQLSYRPVREVRFWEMNVAK